MKKLIFLAILVFAGWYGWNHRDALLHRQGSHEAVIKNDSATSLERVRLIVDGQTMVKESIPAGQSITLPFKINNDSDFKLVWQWGDRIGEKNWEGGMIARGPMLQRHVFEVDNDGNVTYHAEPKGLPTASQGDGGP
jgi:hypothetical protein